MSVIQGDVGGGGGTDATITFSDITTNDVSAAKHGFMPKLPNTATKFWRDDGTYQTIAGGGDALVANPLSQFAATTSAQLAGVITNETGTGALVFATTPTLVTPVLGVATATSVNKVAVTAPATSATLTIADGKTLTVSNDATVSGTNTGDVANTAVTTGTLAQFAATTSAELRTLLSDETGTGVAVFATSPTLVTPALGVATATTINKLSITAPATSATLVISDGKTLTVSNDATVSGTNTGDQTISDATITTTDITTNNFSTTKHGFVPKGTNVGSFLKDDGTWAAISGGGDALTSNPLSQFAATTSLQFKGVISDETGSGSVVFATSPTLVTPDIGVATATSVNKVAFTAPATSATITMTDGKTLSVTNNATISGTNTGDQTVTGRIVSFQVLTSGTTYTRPAGIGPGIVEGWAGGGGGGGVAATNAGQCSLAVGGGSGGYFRHYYAALPASGTYAIGAAGAAGANTGAAAGDGGDTTFTDGSTLLTAKGGKGAQAGLGTAAATGVLAGAQGGVISTNGNLVVAGGTSGSVGIRTGTGGANTSCSGSGGGQFGGGIRGTSGAGIDATGPGGGGGGALGLASAAAAIGGAGFLGLIIVWEMAA